MSSDTRNRAGRDGDAPDAADLSITVAERERRRAADHVVGTVTQHIREESWPERVDSDVTPREAWEAGVPIHYPSAANGTVARLYRPTETILLARQGGLVTCIPLGDRDRWEQAYVRDQVISNE